MSWKSYCLSPSATIRDGLQKIENNLGQILLITDSEYRLLGTATDGNIRRSLLQGSSLDTPLSSVMTKHPITVEEGIGAEQALALMVENEITHMPALDNKGRILWLWSRKAMEEVRPIANPVVIMAGGLGSRLGKLTKETPKPMLQIAGKPILEILLENFISYGFRNFYIAINYKGEQIESYFADGSKMGCKIEYLHESKRMGTAGALSLLPPQNLPIVVTNADLVTRFNLRCLLVQQATTSAQATMLVKRFSYRIPFGVVECNSSGRLVAIREKPENAYQIAAGIYVLSPETLRLIPDKQFFDMPQLFDLLVRNDYNVNVMTTDSYWLDVGCPPDFEQAKQEFVHK